MQSVYKLGRVPILESFDLADASSDPKTATKTSVDWQSGHAVGLAEGHALAWEKQAMISAEIAQTLSDMGFGFTEARLQLLEGLKPLFGALIGRVLPGLADAALATHVISLLQWAAEQDSSTPLELIVSPTQSAGLATLLPYAVGMPVLLVADPEVSPNQAVLRSGRAETCLDVEAIFAGVRAALEAIFETSDERVNYG